MALADDDALARLGVLPAAPFDWGAAPRMNVGGADASDAPAARAPPSGLDSLVAIVNGEADDGDDAEREIIRSLFKEAGVDASSMAASSAKMERNMAKGQQDQLHDVPIKGLSDRGVAEHTIESKTSLFGSVLRLFDAPRAGEEGYIKKGGDATKESSGGKDGAPKAPTAGTPAAVKGGTLSPSPSFLKADDPTILNEPILSTAEIVRSVHLSARPGDVPPGMDSKEFAMAALLFLSGRIPFLHEEESDYRAGDDGGSNEGWEQLRRTLPVLPLIKPVNPEASVELRWYGRVRPLVRLGATGRKEFPDTMDRDEAFRKKVLNLERMYCSSLPFSSKHTVALPPTTQQPAASGKRARHTHDIDAGADDVPFALQRYTPRRKLVPHMEGGVKEELILMISGHMRGSQNAPGGVKGKGSKSKAAAAKGASPVVGSHPIVKPDAVKAGTGIIKTAKTGGAAAK